MKKNANLGPGRHTRKTLEAFRRYEVHMETLPTPIISEKEAVEAGLAFYFTGRACEHKHRSLRRVHGNCIACDRRHYRMHRAQIREQDTARYAAKRSRILKQKARYRAATRAFVNGSRRAKRAAQRHGKVRA